MTLNDWCVLIGAWLLIAVVVARGLTIAARERDGKPDSLFHPPDCTCSLCEWFTGHSPR